jgi:hypothetical protein
MTRSLDHATCEPVPIDTHAPPRGSCKESESAFVQTLREGWGKRYEAICF